MEDGARNPPRGDVRPLQMRALQGVPVLRRIIPQEVQGTREGRPQAVLGAVRQVRRPRSRPRRRPHMLHVQVLPSRGRHSVEAPPSIRRPLHPRRDCSRIRRMPLGEDQTDIAGRRHRRPDGPGDMDHPGPGKGRLRGDLRHGRDKADRIRRVRVRAQGAHGPLQVRCIRHHAVLRLRTHQQDVQRRQAEATSTSDAFAISSSSRTL